MIPTDITTTVKQRLALAYFGDGTKVSDPMVGNGLNVSRGLLRRCGSKRAKDHVDNWPRLSRDAIFRECLLHVSFAEAINLRDAVMTVAQNSSEQEFAAFEATLSGAPSESLFEETNVMAKKSMRYRLGCAAIIDRSVHIRGHVAS